MKREESVLNIRKTIENGKGTVALEGRLDTATSPEREAELDASLDGVRELILDFEKLEYISSAGLRVLLDIYKRMERQGTMTLVHVQKTAMEIFELKGFSDVLTIE